MRRLFATTRTGLLSIGITVLTLVALTTILAFAAADRAHRTAEAVRDDTVQALVDVSAARGALVEADLAAVTSFETDAVRLSGPGDEYRNQIAVANQNLTEAATHDLGEGGTETTLTLVNRLLTSYSSAIEQAAASYRENEDTALWVSDLWAASRVLHAGDGAFALLDKLLDDQKGKLASQVDDGTVPVLATLSLVVSAVLLVVMAGAQFWLRRRFRRTVNLGLLAATLVVLGLVYASTSVFDTSGMLRETEKTTRELTGTWAERMDAKDTEGQLMLAALVDTRCGAEDGECGSTVREVVTTIRSAGPPLRSNAPLTDDSSHIDARARAATGNEWVFRFVLPLAAVVAGVLTVVGLYQRHREYSFRAR